MKYINREYGFIGRPPYLKGFYEESKRKVVLDDEVFDTKPVVGFGLLPQYPNAALLAGSKGTIWGIKISFFNFYGKLIDEVFFLNEPFEYMTGDLKRGFKYLSHGFLTISCVRHKANSLVLSISALDKAKIKIDFFCESKNQEFTKWEIQDRTITGSSSYRAMQKGSIQNKGEETVIKDRYEIFNKNKTESFEAVVLEGDGEIVQGRGEVTYQTSLSDVNSRIVIFAQVGKDMMEVPSKEEIDRGINYAELSFTANKLVGDGCLLNAIDKLLNKLGMNQIYNRFTQEIEYVDRGKLTNDLNVFPSASMAAGTIMSSILNKPGKEQALAYADDTILGPLATWIAYCNTGDKSLLEESFSKWQEKWGSNSDLILSEEKDLRNFGPNFALNYLQDIIDSDIYSLELNTYKLLALDIMEKTTRVLDYKKTNQSIQANLSSFKSKYNETFYNPKLGLYMDKKADGTFVPYFGSTSFLPLVAGAVEDVSILNRLLINLFDTKKFAKNRPLTIISKNNLLFKTKKLSIFNSNKIFDNYLDGILPIHNFLIYMGLVRVGADEASSLFAKACVSLWKEYNNKYDKVPSILSVNKKMPAKDGNDSLIGHLLALIGLLEVISIEYFCENTNLALRLSAMSDVEHHLSKFKIRNKNIRVKTSGRSSMLMINNVRVLEIIGGKFIIKNLSENNKGLKFDIFAQSSLTITMKGKLFTAEKSTEFSTYRFNLDKGKHTVVVEDGQLYIKRMLVN